MPGGIDSREPQRWPLRKEPIWECHRCQSSLYETIAVYLGRGFKGLPGKRGEGQEVHRRGQQSPLKEQHCQLVKDCTGDPRNLNLQRRNVLWVK